MNSLNNELPFLKNLLTMLSAHLGDSCEIVLHDLTKDYTSTIIDIRNGKITNREIGGCGSNLGLEVLRGTVVDGDRFNYITTLSNGKIIRSSTIYIKDDNQTPIGAICINSDITETLKFEEYLKKYNHFETVTEDEFFATDVNSLLSHLIQEAQKQIGKDVQEMNKQDKITFIGYLDKKGAFLITKSSEQICEYLGISRFTFYHYLDISRGGDSSC